MDRYPCVTINKAKLLHNVQAVVGMCHQAGIHVCGVTKVCSGHPEIASVFAAGGVDSLGDSRILNLKRLSTPECPKLLLRIPMISEAEEAVRYCDISLNSEIGTVEALSKHSLRLGKRHGVIMMIELGDLREGMLMRDAAEFAQRVFDLPGVRLSGVGVNMNCYGGIIPDADNLSQLVGVATDIEKRFDVRLEYISGGNSGSLHLLMDGMMPRRINHLRLGEVIMLGRETSFRQRIADLHTDVFILYAEIVELKEKPSVPFGRRGLDAFGKTHSIMDKGVIKRAIVACGRQDISFDGLKPCDEGVELIGASSDHMILDVTHADKPYAVGDTIAFSMDYSALLAAFTSEYVNKIFTQS